MPQIIPITDLGNENEISELCHARKEPVFITKNGYGDMVIMSIEAYEELTEPKPAGQQQVSRRPSDADLDALDALWNGIKSVPKKETE